MSISKSDSERITSLRFLLMVFVVFLHVQLQNVLYKGNLQYVQCFFTIWAKCAVYIFFLISSYLLYLKNDSYFTLIKKKAKTLLIPYLLWPASFLLLVKIIPKFFASVFFPSHLENPWVFYISDWKILDFIRFFTFGDNIFFNPYWAQFWFLRQLILMVIISPILLFFVRRIPLEFFFVLFSIVLGAIPIFDELILHIVFTSLLFFYIGALCATYKFSFFEFADKFKWPILAICFVIGFIVEDILKLNTERVFKLGNIFIRSLILLKFSKILIQENSDEKKRRIFLIFKSLSVYSFFLYAVHMEILNPFLSRIYKSVICIDSDVKILGHFFFVAIGDIILGIILGMILKKIFPSLYSLYNGDR